MTNNQIYIDNIYWERVQLFIEGHFNSTEDVKNKFVLRNLTETKELKANEVKINNNRFQCRFNIAILDNGYYMPGDKYLLVNKSDFEYIATIDPKVLTDIYDNLDDKQLEIYESKETNTQQKNYLLNSMSATFRKGGNSKKTYYNVKPEIYREVNEFVLNVSVRIPTPKKNPFVKKIKDYRNKIKKTNYNIRNFIFKSIFKVTKFFHLRNGNTILFTSDSRSEMSGNFKFVYDEMIKRGIDKKYNIHALFKRNISDRRGILDKFKLPYLLGKADYIFVDDFHPMIYKVKFRSSQEVIQVWHAVGAFKTVGFSRTGKKGGPFFDSYNHRSYTKAFVSSATDIPFYAEAFGIKEQNVIPTGVPRTDILFDNKYKKETENRMAKILPIIKNKNVILFAPTFRGNGHRSAHYPFFKIDFEKLASYCESNNTVVLFKMHPFVKNKLEIPKKYKKYFMDISSFREVNDVLFITDLLISDYSSLIYEFSVFEKPMLFFAFDLEDYIATRDFYEGYEEFVPGKIVESFDELLEALYKKDFEKYKVKPFLDKHFKYQDGRSSERLVRHLFGS